MGFAARIADETAHHYDELRQRRMPWPLVWLMASRFHRDLSYSVIQDEQFKAVVANLLNPKHADEEAAR